MTKRLVRKVKTNSALVALAGMSWNMEFGVVVQRWRRSPAAAVELDTARTTSFRLRLQVVEDDIVKMR